MPLRPEKNDFKKDLIPAGMYPARCIGVYDLCTQLITFEGREKEQRKVLLVFEIPGLTYEFVEGDQVKTLPRCISKRYTLSYDTRSNLYKDLSSWRNKKLDGVECSEFDILTVLGAACTLQVIHEDGKNDSTWANINSIMPVIAVPPERVLELSSYSLEDNEDSIPADVPGWVVKKIKESKEWQSIDAQAGDDAEYAQSQPEDHEDESGGCPF